MNGRAALEEAERSGPPRAASPPRAYRALVRGALAVHAALVRAAGRGTRPVPASGHRILLTSTFHSDNWIRAHLAPLAASPHCAEIVMVGSTPGPRIDKVRWIVAPLMLRRSIGGVPARLLTFAWTAVRTRPSVVGGFHLLVNGLVALLIGRLVRARTWYFSVGGPTELRDGGIHGENAYFLKLRVADPIVERRLLDAVGGFDTVITMGEGAVTFLRGRGAVNCCHAIPGGVDAPAAVNVGLAAPDFDAVLVARLVPIKRIDVFLEAVAIAGQTRGGVRALIVGDGPLRTALERRAAELRIADRVTFAGQQQDVTPWLRRARVFMLTSASEGVALSLMEALASGLPGIVPDVGDLRDVVEDGVNGVVVTDRRPEIFGRELADLLSDPTRLARMGAAAAAAAARYSTAGTTQRWDAILAGVARQRSNLKS